MIFFDCSISKTYGGGGGQQSAVSGQQSAVSGQQKEIQNYSLRALRAIGVIRAIGTLRALRTLRPLKKYGCGAFTPNRRHRLSRDFCAKAAVSNQKTQSVQQMQGGTRKPPPQFTDVNEEVVYRSATQQLLCNMRFMRGFP